MPPENILQIEFDSTLEGGFGAYLAGSYSDKKPQIKINLVALLHLVNDSQITNDDSRRAELFNYFLSETIVHELIHIFQEAFNKEFSEVEIENILQVIRDKTLENSI